MTRILWSIPAQTDLTGIDAHYRAIHPEIADRMLNAAVASGRFLMEFPNAGRPIGDGRRRKWSVGGTPYRLLYRLDRDTVRILRVVHAASDWTNR